MQGICVLIALCWVFLIRIYQSTSSWWLEMSWGQNRLQAISIHHDDSIMNVSSHETCYITQTADTTQPLYQLCFREVEGTDSDSDRDLFNIKLHLEVLHQGYIAKQYEHIEQIWTWHNQNACWETSTKIIADCLNRGHPEHEGSATHQFIGYWWDCFSRL